MLLRLLYGYVSWRRVGVRYGEVRTCENSRFDDKLHQAHDDGMRSSEVVASAHELVTPGEHPRLFQQLKLYTYETCH